MELTKALFDFLVFALGVGLGILLDWLREKEKPIWAVLAFLMGGALFFGLMVFRYRIPDGGLTSCEADESSRQYAEASKCYMGLREYFPKNSLNHLKATSGLINTQVLNAAFGYAFDLIGEPDTRAHLADGTASFEKAKLLGTIAFFYCFEERDSGGARIRNFYASGEACDSSLSVARKILPSLDPADAEKIGRQLHDISRLRPK
jgi:hypothetical protein